MELKTDSGSSAVSAAMERVRQVVNSTPMQSQLWQDASKWNAICAAMDSIEDVCGVLDAFLTRDDADDWQSRLLAIYGVLQAMFVQQDATKSLADALGHPFTDKKWSSHLDLKDIRDLRNRSIGHPSDYSPNPKQARPGGHISRPSISRHGMTVMIVDGKSTKIREVSIPELISTQCERLAEIINTTVDSAISSDSDFKAKFQNNQLIKAFDTSGYYWQKVAEAIRNYSTDFGIMHLDLLDKVADEFESGVIARFGPDGGSEYVQHSLGEYRYVIMRLRSFFDGKMGERDAAVFCRDLESQRKSLEDLAREIDETFCHDAEGNPLPWAPQKPDLDPKHVVINLIGGDSTDTMEDPSD